MKILIIEDEIVIAQNLKELLREMGYLKIRICKDEESFSKAIEQEIPDLIFVDIYLEGEQKTGIDLVHESGIFNQATIIILSSYDDEEYRKKASTISANAYLIKPSDKKQIDVTIDIALRNKYRTHSPSIPEQESNTLLSSAGYFFTKKGDLYEKIKYGEISYADAAGSYAEVHTIFGSKFMLSTTLKYLLEHIPEGCLVRCHRGHAVNPNYIKAFDERNIYMENAKDTVKIPVGTNYKSNITKYLPRI